MGVRFVDQSLHTFWSAKGEKICRDSVRGEGAYLGHGQVRQLGDGGQQHVLHSGVVEVQPVQHLQPRNMGPILFIRFLYFSVIATELWGVIQGSACPRPAATQTSSFHTHPEH